MQHLIHICCNNYSTYQPYTCIDTTTRTITINTTTTSVPLYIQSLLDTCIHTQRVRRCVGSGSVFTIHRLNTRTRVHVPFVSVVLGVRVGSLVNENKFWPNDGQTMVAGVHIWVKAIPSGLETVRSLRFSHVWAWFSFAQIEEPPVVQFSVQPGCTRIWQDLYPINRFSAVDSIVIQCTRYTFRTLLMVCTRLTVVRIPHGKQSFWRPHGKYFRHLRAMRGKYTVLTSCRSFR